MPRLLVPTLLLGLLSSSTGFADDTTASAAEPARVAASRAEADPLMSTLGDELDRIWTHLSKQPEAPHWMHVQVVDEATVEVQATHGSASAIEKSRRRMGDVDIRVGTPDLDSTHKIRDAGWYSEENRVQIELPLEDDNDRALRLALWRAADDTYRTAMRRLIKVRTNDAIKVEREDDSADFSAAPAVVQIDPLTPQSVDGKVWQDRVRAASAVFLEYPEIYDSNVSFHAQDVVTRMLSSEGTRVRHQRVHFRVSMWASTVASDGMRLQVYDYVDASSPAKLPDNDALIAMAHDVAAKLVALRQAPLIDPYVGPAILRGRAAAVFFHEILGHRVEGHRQKDEDEGQTLTEKVGKQIFPDLINVHDDPTLAAWEGVDLNGHYSYDDEAVAAERVAIVENGVLKGFLTSRTPIKGFPSSNGHGRRQPGSAVVPRQGNLVVSANTTVPYAELRAQLIEAVRAANKPFGLIFDDISGGFTFTGRTTPNSYSVKPVTVWRVFPDGKPDELVRGVDMIGTPLTTFGRIAAASDETLVFNGMCGAESGWVPVAAVAPDLLVTEVEVQRSEKENDRPPILAAPLPMPIPAEASR